MLGVFISPICIGVPEYPGSKLEVVSISKDVIGFGDIVSIITVRTCPLVPTGNCIELHDCAGIVESYVERSILKTLCPNTEDIALFVGEGDCANV